MHTVRFGTIALTLFLIAVQHSSEAGEPTTDPVVRALESQKALASARKLLSENQPEQAVTILENNLAGADGATTYFALLRDAYIAELRRLRLENNNPARLALIRERLRRLDPTADTDTATAAAPIAPPPLAPAPVDFQNPPQTPAPPAPPEPIAFAEPIPSASSALLLDERTASAPAPESPFVAPPTEVPTPARDFLGEGRQAFLERRFVDAADLLSRAHQAAPLQGKELGALVYCKLAKISDRLKDGKPIGNLVAEAEEAYQLAKEMPTLREQASKLLAEARKRQGAGGGGLPSGSQVVESASFRIIHHGNPDTAARVRDEAEQVRAKVFSTWAGPNAVAWQPKCEIHLHSTGSAYEQATGKPSRLMGHAGVAIRDGKVVSRRIDLRIDDSTLLSGSVPEHVADVVLGDLFLEQPLPRWAEVAMTALAKPAGEVSRYSRTLPRCRADGSFIAVADLLALKDFPAPERITAFYVESVSLVEFLVRRRGPKTFVIFVKQAQRYGYEKALREQYGYSSIKELQNEWLSVAHTGG